MTAGQFHLEAELTDRVATRLAGTRLSEQATDAAIVSLLVSVSTRGWLSDPEKEFLDALVPSHNICFLICDGKYLHPEAVPLLDPDQLEASYLQENAVYTHRQRLVSESFSSSRVHAARLGELNGRQITFGMVGRDNGFDTARAADKFSTLVDSFRLALERVRPVAERLSSAMDGESPAILVNRCSGRIIAANAAATRDGRTNAADIVDTEFTTCKGLLTELFTQCTLHAEHIRVDQIDLSLVSFKRRQTRSIDLADEMYPRFIASLRRATQALHSTAHHLEGIISWQPGHPETELLRLIHEETSELDQIVHRYQLLTVYHRLTAERINPAEELRKTVTHAAINHPTKQLSMTEQWSTQVELALPREALAVLYETILETHLTSCGCRTTTSVSLSADVSGRLEIRIETSTQLESAHLHCADDWTDYIASLGRLLGFTVHHRIADGTTITTILTHQKDSLGHE